MRSNYEILSIFIMFLSIIGIVLSFSVFATPLPESEQGQQHDVQSEQDDSGDGTSTAEQIEPKQEQEPITEGQQSLDDSAGPDPESERRYECDPRERICDPRPPPEECDPDIACCMPSPPPQPRPEKDKCEPIKEEDSSDSREGIRG